MVQSRWDMVDVDGHPMPLWVATPEGNGPFPAVIVNQGLGSVEHVIQTLTERVAEAGFVAAAPVYYHRQDDNILEEVKGLPPGSPERVQRLFEKVKKLRDNEIVDDGLAALRHLRSLPTVESTKAGVIGFCLGGRITWVQAASIADFACSVPFYPGGVWTAWGDGPTAFDLTPGIQAPVCGIFGSEDTNPSPDDRDKLDAELNRLGIPHEFHTYEAAHDFQNFSAARYNEAAAKASWPVAMDFLRKHLG